MEYTPRCIWCLRFNSLAPQAADRLSAAYELCLALPLSNLPCPGDCGNLTAHIQDVILPCEKAAATVDQEQNCRCSTTAKGLFETCHFCLLGWNETQAQAVESGLDVCNGTFVDDDSSESETYPSTSATMTDQRAMTEETTTSENITISKTMQSASGYRYAEWSFLPKFPTLSDDDPSLLPLISTPSPVSQDLGSLTETTTAIPTWPYGAWNLLAPPGEISLPPQTSPTSIVILERGVQEPVPIGPAAFANTGGGGVMLDNRSMRLYNFLMRIAGSLILAVVLFDFC